EPVMLGVIKNDTEAANIRRIVHNSQNIYGLLVSLDDKAALIRANYVEGRLDHRRTFIEVNEWVQNPFGAGWIGALFTLPPADEKPEPGALVETVYKDTAADKAGIKQGDRIMAVNGQPVETWSEASDMIATVPAGAGVTLSVKRDNADTSVSLTVPEQNADVYIAGEPRLYGWIYNYANDVFWILVVTYCIEWV